jgi:hypothetical protein
MKNLSREAILHLVDRTINTSNTTTTENVTTENRGTQEQTRKGPDMETRLKDLEDRVAKLEALHNQK